MLDLNLWLMIFVAALFLGLVYILNKILYKPLMMFMDKREKSIRDDMASSTKNSDDIDDLLNQANEKISIAKSEAAVIKEDATNKAKNDALKKLEQSTAKIEGEYTSFLQQLSKDKISLKKSVSANVASYQNDIKIKIKNI